MGKDISLINDQLGKNPNINPVIIPDYDQELVIEQHPISIDKVTLGNSWIVGSSTNGLVGANTGTQNGLQQVVGSAGRVTTLAAVISPEDTFKDEFNYDDFVDTANTTATVNTTDGRIDF